MDTREVAKARRLLSILYKKEKKMEFINTMLGYLWYFYIYNAFSVLLLLFMNTIICWDKGYTKDDIAGSFLILLFGALPISQTMLVVWLVLDNTKEFKRRRNK